MCGIAGYFSNQSKNISDTVLETVAQTLHRRGPDFQKVQRNNNGALIHARLSIIDTSSNANQPFTDASGRYTIVFNGEIFNFHQLKEQLKDKNIHYTSTSDTEVLLYYYIYYGKECLNQLNGFFAFAIYDNIEQELFVAVDRYSIKPLYYTFIDNVFYFGSELKALMAFPIPRNMNWSALSLYFQLNYIPDQQSVFDNIYKLTPGHCLTIKSNTIKKEQWYQIDVATATKKYHHLSYEQQQQSFYNLLEDAVRLRLMADVPLGAFLSGGIDSSVMVALAKNHTQHLNTFSIGFKDSSFFDETEYANLVANHFKTNHTVFKLSNDDLLESLYDVLDYTDEPFADSSALLVNLLSKYTRQHVTVALSGDGGDELFAGYNKHYGEWQMRNGGWKSQAVYRLKNLWQLLPKSRSGGFTNKIRQLERFADGMDLSKQDRYWQWCCFNSIEAVNELLKGKTDTVLKSVLDTKQQFTKFISNDGTLNDNLLADVNLVLPYDMLVKVDRMSMRNSLEVRSPFLDYRVVEFAFGIPVESKINQQMKKKIVQDSFRSILPKELYNRPKSGFEVPLLQWFRTDLKDYIFNEVLNDGFIIEQNIFDINIIKQYKQQLLSNNPADVHAKIWALIVFQNFYKKYVL
ncbi:MAG: asparagine synthase (glutamine-hydrolyzing) [Chitinophagales bacterium]|nr:asparagine synthase (glutamine-hydrolyzing) [Chitinophagales bacterium]